MAELRECRCHVIDADYRWQCPTHGGPEDLRAQVRRQHSFPTTSTLYHPRDVQLDRCDYCSQTRGDAAPECPGNQPATVDGVAWAYRHKLDQLASMAAASSMSAAWTLHSEIESARKRLHDHLDGNGLTGSVHDDRTSS